MKNPLFAISIVTALLAFSGCSKVRLAGVSATKYVSIPEGYSGVVAKGAMTVEVSSSYTMAEVVSDSNVLPYINVTIQDNLVVIGYEDGVRFSSGDPRTVVRLPYVPGLATVRISDMVMFRSLDEMPSVRQLRLEADDMSVFELGDFSASAARITLRNASSLSTGTVLFDEAILNLSGASSVSMDGRIQECEVIMKDASSLSRRNDSQASGLSIDRFSCTMSGMSAAYFHSDGTISGTLRDGSSIHYSGTAVCESVSRFDGSEIVREDG